MNDKHNVRYFDAAKSRTKWCVQTNLLPELTDERMGDDIFEPNFWRNRNKITGQATGRSTAFFLDLGEHGALLRHYYRGGLIGKFNRDRFAKEAFEKSRAVAEFNLLLKLRALGLPVPNPLAARYKPASLWGYRADILVEVIPQAQDVFHVLQERPLLAECWQDIGRVIATFHQHGVYHSDLNCHNIMLDRDAKIWLVDFDKCDIRAAGDWQHANLERLLRSLKKEQKKASELGYEFHWHESDWAHLLTGYSRI